MGVAYFNYLLWQWVLYMQVVKAYLRNIIICIDSEKLIFATLH